MKNKSLSAWLKGILIAIGICGLAIYIYVVPQLGRQMMSDQNVLAASYMPWMIFMWISAVPCFAMVGFGWLIACNIGKNEVFCNANAHWLRMISLMSVIDAVMFFVANLILIIMRLYYPSIMLGSLLVIFAGVVVAVVTAALSSLIRRAAKLQEENDLTI